ncbi:hypothetical protein ACNSTU_15435 [Aquisalimonas sp. APHAB1-3]|uniref:hypothetical protein n=1 Tax=Aquisalimonas sp. APHAB1-3 TaxID=3402080 RepID=UPI003AAABCA8
MRALLRTLTLTLCIAAPHAHGAEPFFRALDPVDDALLADMRGGFMLPGGGMLTLSMDSGVLINGDYAAHVQWENGRVLLNHTGLDAEGLRVGALDADAMAAGQSIGWVVQNQLDNVRIQNYTEFNVDLQGMRGVTSISRDRMLEAQAVMQVIH